MLKLFRSLPILLLLAVSGIAPAWAQDLIPMPARVEAAAGTFDLGPRTVIVAPDDRRSQEIAAFARESLARDTGIEFGAAGKSGDRIELKLDASVAHAEGYRLEVGPRRIRIVASTHRGMFWGVQTLRQWLPPARAGSVAIPAVRIEDAPAFGYRGHMLDVSRHFMPVEFVKKQIDLLAYYKINTFRWHLTDDQGWRIEIRRYPRLTEVGAWRTEPDGSRHGGYYTQEQVREVVEYARLRNIMVIPEIEMPGHASAALAAYPHLSCRRQPIRVPNSWGVFKDVFCAGDESTFEFIEGVLDEVIALFPAPYLHIGGDEAPKDRWQESASSQRRMREEGLKDEHELQSYFVRRIQRYLESKGKTLIGWDEILEGGADRNAIVEVWRGDAEGVKALANGNRIISAGPFYLDSPTGVLTLEKVYRTDLLAHPAYVAHRVQVLGAEAPLWAEHVTTRNAEAMLYPRLLAFSEVAWSHPGVRDYAAFRQRLASHYRRLEDWQVAYGPEDKSLVDYRLRWNAGEGDWTLQAERGFDDMRIHYTFDGSEPTAASPSFTDRLSMDEPVTVSVVPFRGGRPYMAPRRFEISGHLALGKPLDLAPQPARRYREGGATVLVDGLFGGDRFDDGLWAGWQGEDLVAIIDLQQAVPVRSISARFLQEGGAWILLPKAVRYAVSVDGRHWTRVDARSFDADAGETRRFVEEVTFTARQPLTARYVRMEVERPGLLPEGHGGAGKPAYFFVDEIVVH